MFIRISLTLILAATSNAASAAPPPSIGGVWQQDDGSTTVRVAPCPDSPSSPSWCATVLKETLTANQPSLVGQTIVRDMRAKGQQAWVGRYVVDGQSMKASAKLLRADSLSFKICAIAFLCETLKFRRIG